MGALDGAQRDVGTEPVEPGDDLAAVELVGHERVARGGDEAEGRAGLRQLVRGVDRVAVARVGLAVVGLGDEAPGTGHVAHGRHVHGRLDAVPAGGLALAVHQRVERGGAAHGGADVELDLATALLLGPVPQLHGVLGGDRVAPVLPVEHRGGHHPAVATQRVEPGAVHLVVVVGALAVEEDRHALGLGGRREVDPDPLAVEVAADLLGGVLPARAGGQQHEQERQHRGGHCLRDALHRHLCPLVDRPLLCAGSTDTRDPGGCEMAPVTAGTRCPCAARRPPTTGGRRRRRAPAPSAGWSPARRAGPGSRWGRCRSSAAGRR